MRSIVLLVIGFAAIQVCRARNLTEILSSGYNKNQLPSTDGVVKVEVTAHILSLPLVDSTRGTMTVDLYLRQSWTDPRLINDGPQAKEGNEILTKIWIPDTFFVNEISSARHDVTVPNVFVRVDNQGSVMMSTRYTVTTVCPMNYQDFPFDTQMCAINIESYRYSAREVEYSWKKQNLSSGLSVSPMFNQEFTLVATRGRTTKISFPTGTYAQLHIDIMLRRLAGRYYNEFFYPCVILSFMAIISMVAIEPIVSVGIHVVIVCFTVILTALVSSDYPNVSTATAIDSFGSITNTFVLLSFILSLVAYVLKGKGLGPESHELASFSRGRVRLGNDESVNLCTEPGQGKGPDSKIQATLKLVAGIVTKIYPLLKLALLVIWGVTNFFYLTTRPYASSTPDENLLNTDWNIHE